MSHHHTINPVTTSRSGPIRTLDGGAPISEAFRRIEEMIRRKAPLFMKVGGWSGGAATKYKVGRKELTNRQVERLLALCAEGWSFGRIAVELGCNDSTVGRIARKNGVHRGCKGNGGAFNVKVPTFQVK